MTAVAPSPTRKAQPQPSKAADGKEKLSSIHPVVREAMEEGSYLVWTNIGC